MPIYFRKASGEPLERRDYSLMSIVFPCEIHGGAVVFGPYDGRTFEVIDDESYRFDKIRKIFERDGYVEVNRPDHRPSPPKWTEEFLPSRKDSDKKLNGR